MSDLVLEFYSEEIPARMQVRAVNELKKIFTTELKEELLSFDSLDAYATPRRLALIIWGLADKSSPFSEEKKGPRVGSSSRALTGFAESVNAKISSLYTRKEKKGEFYFYKMDHFGSSSEELIKKITVKIANNFPWQKSMRWGDGNFRWVRPLRSILFASYRKNCQPTIIKLELNGIKSSGYTIGHVTMNPQKFYPKSATDYISGLESRHVILDAKHREKIIFNAAKKLIKDENSKIIRDNSLLSEVAGLVEWPVVLIGKIDKEFLKLPKEILQVSMKEHQKFFSVVNIPTGLIEKFILVANINSKDKGKSILEGNSRVLRSRLKDAKFFFEKDLEEIKYDSFAALNKRLETVTFHNKVGSQMDRVSRIRSFSLRIAKLLTIDAQKCDQVAKLCKTDLTTKIVAEFPELQGIMGSIYCKLEGMEETIYNAISNHYKPLSQNDRVPNDEVSIVVAIADRVSTLVSFWAIGEKPTGSKDPFALRRGAIGLIRILVENRLNIKLSDLVGNSLDYEIAQDLYNFIAERFKVYLVEKGFSHDLLHACLKLDSFENPYVVFTMIDQLNKFKNDENFSRLMYAYRRPNNILSSEENKAKRKYEQEPLEKLFSTVEEKKLMQKLLSAEPLVIASILKDDYISAFRTLADLDEVVKDFFENVTINSEVQEEKENRLYLCNKVRKIMHLGAKFSELKL